jgi:prepilin-type processing-associated H-X9-DG protein
LLPAVHSAREASRNLQCKSNLKQLALAFHQYEAAHRVLPEFGPNNYSFYVTLLPQLEQKPLLDEFDLSVNAMDLDYSSPLHARRLSVLECPSDRARAVSGLPAATNYQGNWGTGIQRDGNNGVFCYGSLHPGYVRYLPLSAISDGLSQTAMLAEVLAGDRSSDWMRVYWLTANLGGPEQLDDFAKACREAPQAIPTPIHLPFPRGRPWIEGGVGMTLYNHVLPPNQASCMNGGDPARGAHTSSSLHDSAINVAFADGSVQSVSDTIEITAWRAFGSRAGDP